MTDNQYRVLWSQYARVALAEMEKFKIDPLKVFKRSKLLLSKGPEYEAYGYADFPGFEFIGLAPEFSRLLRRWNEWRRVPFLAILSVGIAKKVFYPMILVIKYRRKVIDKAFPTGCRVIEAYQKRIPHHPKIPLERVFLVTKFRLAHYRGCPD